MLNKTIACDKIRAKENIFVADKIENKVKCVLPINYIPNYICIREDKRELMYADYECFETEKEAQNYLLRKTWRKQ